MDDTIKYCVDCKWCIPQNPWNVIALCTNPECLPKDGSYYVDKRSYPFCTYARCQHGSNTTCGPEGKFWAERLRDEDLKPGPIKEFIPTNERSWWERLLYGRK